MKMQKFYRIGGLNPPNIVAIILTHIARNVCFVERSYSFGEGPDV